MNNFAQLHMLCKCLLAPGHTKVQPFIRWYMSCKFKMALIVKYFRKSMTYTHDAR